MWVMIITNFMLVKHYIVVPVIKSTWFFIWLLDFMSICEYVDIYQQMLILITPVFIFVLFYLST